jgi:flagellar export protein FliJ
VSLRSRQRAERLARITRIGETLAAVAEGAAADRRRTLFTEQDRLETVRNYLGDYGAMVQKREASMPTVSGLRLYRDFSGWLTELSQKQQNEVAQAEFLLEAALEEVREKRRFADALDRVSEKAGRAARREAEAEEQKTLDDMVRQGRSASLGTQVATPRLAISTGNKTP